MNIRMESYLFSVIYISAIVQVSLLQPITRFSLTQSSFGKGLDYWRLDVIYGLPHISDCAKECYYIRLCASFQFNKATHKCVLNTRNGTQTGPDGWSEDSQLTFSYKKDWPKVIAGTCADEPCSLKEKCLPGRTPTCIREFFHVINETKCVRQYDDYHQHAVYNNYQMDEIIDDSMAYCGEVSYLAGTYYFAGCRHKGCVLVHGCSNGFVATTTDMGMTCQDNGNWTWSFQCIRHCGTPPNVINAIVGPGLETQDANRTYTCQEPYVATSTSTTITCRDDSTWTAPQFQCID